MLPGHTTTCGVVVAGVNLVAGVGIPAILAGWISKTDLQILVGGSAAGRGDRVLRAPG